jgi:hypothetical protein
MIETLGRSVGILVFGGWAAWGFIAPVLDLRKRGELRPISLLSSYWSHVRLVPRALWTALALSARHPFGPDTPVFGYLLVVLVAWLGAISGAVYTLFGASSTADLPWWLLFALFAVGMSMGLVRDMQRQVDRTSDPHDHRTDA